jgi:hypothetical protein
MNGSFIHQQSKLQNGGLETWVSLVHIQQSLLKPLLMVRITAIIVSWYRSETLKLIDLLKELKLVTLDQSLAFRAKIMVMLSLLMLGFQEHIYSKGTLMFLQLEKSRDLETHLLCIQL